MSILMRKWYSILLLFVACSPEKIGTDENVAIYGLWEAGEIPSIKALLLDSEGGSTVSNQSFELVYPDGERLPFVFTGSDYVSESERTPQPGDTLVLLWYRDRDTASVVIAMPPALNNVIVLNDTLQADGTEECRIEWEMDNPDFEFALRLECIELNPLPLPWSPGNFFQLYDGPQVATQLNLSAATFACYGTSELTISVLNDELRDAFFFDLSDIRGLLKQGPDNVIGGKGFVTGISTKKILLEIE